MDVYSCGKNQVFILKFPKLKRIQNSAPTIQILNLCAVNGKHRDITYGYMLEKYLRDSSLSKENCAVRSLSHFNT
jgi:hypothetical protein